ncbi:MAG: hypothetical protein MHM6MM_002280 [Cercozoa sp. M6MM]
MTSKLYVASAVTAVAVTSIAVYWLRELRKQRKEQCRRAPMKATAPPMEQLSTGRTQQFVRWLQQELRNETLGSEHVLNLMMMATRYRDTTALEEILKCVPLVVKCDMPMFQLIGYGGWNDNPLFIALKDGSTECTKLLLEAGVPIEEVELSTPLLIGTSFSSDRLDRLECKARVFD